MDIFQFALEKEKLSEDYYRQLAGRVKITGLQNIFTMLAEEEAGHYKTVEQMRAGPSAAAVETAVLGRAKKIFEKMRTSAEKFSLKITELELYKKARDIEQQSMDFYKSKSAEVQDAAVKKLFLSLAEQERKHFVLMDNIVDFVSRPETWLENAEFYHLDEY